REALEGLLGLLDVRVLHGESLEGDGVGAVEEELSPIYHRIHRVGSPEAADVEEREDVEREMGREAKALAFLQNFEDVVKPRGSPEGVEVEHEDADHGLQILVRGARAELRRELTRGVGERALEEGVVPELLELDVDAHPAAEVHAEIEDVALLVASGAGDLGIEDVDADDGLGRVEDGAEERGEDVAVLRRAEEHLEGDVELGVEEFHGAPLRLGAAVPRGL